MQQQWTVTPVAVFLMMAITTFSAIAGERNPPNTATSFSGAKKLLYDEVYQGHQISFYCGCRYDEKRRVDLTSCGLEALADKPRAQRIEAEHVFPASQFGNFRRCWREPEAFPECVKDSGKTVSGRTCCERVDPVFEAAHNDLHNLFPAVGEINGRRSNYNWGVIPGEKKHFGRCDIEVDSKTRRAEPPASVQGDIARTHFYTEQTYEFRLSDQDRQLYTAWDRQDPPDEWEIERNRRIAEIQGEGNPFIERRTRGNQSKPVEQITDASGALMCGEKRTRGQMSSCAEARFYLEHCGRTQLDGNDDGTPCNALCR